MAPWLAILLIVAGCAVAIGLIASLRRRRSSPRERARLARSKARRQPLSRNDQLSLLGSLIALAGVITGIVALATRSEPPAPKPLPTVRVDLAASRFNPAGTDRASEEYVCLVNYGEKAVDVGGWSVRDSTRDVNTLPQLTLRAKRFLRVHPGEGTSSSTDVYGSSKAVAWNNQGDTVVLVDALGRTIDQRPYGARKQGDGSATCGSTPPPTATTPTRGGLEAEEATTSTGSSQARERHGESAGTTTREKIEDVGSTSHAEDSTFCSEHTCIGDFTTQSGTIAECMDGTYSHAGGSPGACSHHGGVRRD